MVVFNFFITCIESLILSGFIAFTFNLEKYKLSLIILSLIFTIETTFFNSIYINNFILLGIEVATGLIYIHRYKRDIRFIYIFVLCIGVALIMLSNIIAIFFISFIMNVQIININSSLAAYISAVCLSKLLFLLLCIPIISILKKNNNSLQLGQWWLLLLFLSLIILTVIVLLESIVFDTYSNNILIFIICSLVLLLIIAVIIYYKINKENNKKIELTKNLIKNEYINKNYQIMNYLYNKIIADKHEMIYLMIKFKNLAKDKKIDVLIDSLDHEIAKVDKFVTIKSTSNPYFDFKLREKLDELKDEDFKIKTFFQLNELSILMQENIVNNIIESIDWIIQYSDENKYISIYLFQKQSYLIINVEVSSSTKPSKYDIKWRDDSIKMKIVHKNNRLILNLLIPTN